MKNNDLHFNKVTDVEIRLILGLIIIALLNIIIFRNLSSAGQISLLSLFNSFDVYLYGTSIIAIIIFTLFKLRKLLRYIFMFLLSVMTFNIVLNLVDLIFNHRISDNGLAIVADASLILFSSLGVFAFWYWLIDHGGPITREIESSDTRYDLLFPQYQSKIPGWEKWKPEFWDYYVFSFFTSTGFSPADTLPLSLKAKILMMIEASISLIIIGMVISRALSLIQ